jgi:hypothetical protein
MDLMVFLKHMKDNCKITTIIVAGNPHVNFLFTLQLTPAKIGEITQRRAVSDKRESTVLETCPQIMSTRAFFFHFLTEK